MPGKLFLIAVLFYATPALAQVSAVVSLAWTWQANPGSAAPTEYVIQKQSASGSFSEIGRTPSLAYSQDVTGAAGESVCYQILAANKVSVSAPSNVWCGTLPAPVIPGKRKVTIKLVAP